jgi:CO/xanthine dehydrogenase Mo-binding subunit
MATRKIDSIDVYGATLSRRQFVTRGGALIVGFSLVGPELLKKSIEASAGSPGRNSMDPKLASSWFEIHADNTMLLRTGKCDFGQSSVTTAYKQIVAEELDFPIDAITSLAMGDTDRTPDGGFSAGFLTYGGANLRKAAAYTYQALLDVAAKKLRVDKSQLITKGGVVSGGGKTITYGELVAGQQLALTIPVDGDLTSMFGLIVTGNPPLKPTNKYTVVGKSYPNYVTASKVAARETWVTDVRLPGMLHGRVVHPKTLGSTLVSAGEVDRKRFPNAQLVVKGNLVGVVAPSEWEAIGAAQQVAAATKWTDWKGLPANANLYKWMREEADWKTAPVTKGKNQGDAAAALATGVRKLKASYELPFMKHAPMGPTVAVADAKSDGTVIVHTHNQNASALRGQLALMLGTSIDNVVVRTYAGAGHYGRSNGGNAGAEDEAVLLSKAVGHPVRVQWMRPDDFMWSTQSPAAFSDVQLALDARGNIIGAELDHYMPAMQDDRPVGAILAGLPTMPPPDVKTVPGGVGSIVNDISDPWLYDVVPNVGEFGHGTFQIGQKASPIAVGLRDHSMRTPGQLQQNFPRELAMSEAAALAGADPIDFRIKHTKHGRLIGVLEAVRDASGWQTRPSPVPRPAAASPALAGQGVSVMLRAGTYWACVCQVSVSSGTGKVAVDKYTIAVDPGIVVNPLQLRRQIQGGAMMGISHALHEEMMFDESGVTSRDWRTYPIATMADVPEINVVILNKPEVGEYGGGSEAANALAISAIAAAVFDATGKVPRRLPLKPAYVQSILKA